MKSEASRSETSGSSGEACVSGADGGSAGAGQLAGGDGGSIGEDQLAGGDGGSIGEDQLAGGDGGSAGEDQLADADDGSAGEDQLGGPGDGSGRSLGEDCGWGRSQGGRGRLQEAPGGLEGESGLGRDDSAALQVESDWPGEDSERLQEDTEPGWSQGGDPGPGRSQGEDGDSGRETGGNNDSGGPDGGRGPDVVPGTSADSAGWARVAYCLRVLMLKPHASQNGPEAAVPHRGQTSARGGPDWPGMRCLPAVSGPPAGPLPTREPQMSQTSSLAES